MTLNKSSYISSYAIAPELNVMSPELALVFRCEVAHNGGERVGQCKSGP